MEHLSGTILAEHTVWMALVIKILVKLHTRHDF